MCGIGDKTSYMYVVYIHVCLFMYQILEDGFGGQTHDITIHALYRSEEKAFLPSTKAFFLSGLDW